ncbi:MAG: class I SAM-dependent methyltransferase [Anaerolineales bacterium]
MSSSPALPPAALLTAQAAWLAPAREYLLRRVGIDQRARVLDLGAGRGAVIPELLERAGGQVLALDLDLPALREIAPEAVGVGGDARALPLASASLDLVFSQLTLLWVRPLAAVLDEVARVLRPGGALVALEPDYGGLMEYPPEVATRSVWMAALSRAGADPRVGRKLPGALERRRFDARVEFQNRLVPPRPARFELLRGLPLTAEERTALQQAEEAAEKIEGRWGVVAHLPFFFVTAIKGRR